MSRPSTHTHPNPLVNRAVQYGALILAAVILLAAPLQIVLALLLGDPGAFLFVTAVLTLLLVFPLALLFATPPVTVDDEGLRIEPRFGRPRLVPWTEVQAVKQYPLLPVPDSETGRKMLVGRKKYRPHRGIMLVIPGLPLPYRIAGFFAGEHLTSIIAVTTRTHTDYDRLVKVIARHTGFRPGESVQ